MTAFRLAGTSQRPMNNSLGVRQISVAAAVALAGIHLAALAFQAQPSPDRSLTRSCARSAGFLPPISPRSNGASPSPRSSDTDRREVAVVGAIRIKAARERLVDRYRDVSNLRGSDIVLELGTFSDPPRVEDLRGLTAENYDLETIRDCKPGDCGVRVSAETMARFGARGELARGGLAGAGGSRSGAVCSRSMPPRIAPPARWGTTATRPRP